MRISVDRARCEGHGLCVDAAPELFQLDDDGELVFSREGRDIPAEYAESALGAARVCPIAALAVQVP